MDEDKKLALLARMLAEYFTKLIGERGPTACACMGKECLQLNCASFWISVLQQKNGQWLSDALKLRQAVEDVGLMK